MTQRTCGDCQLCCRLLPVVDLGKPASTRCQHQCRKGCAIYAHKPISCEAWSCLWLQGDDTGPRPDRAHLCVDPMPDFVVRIDDLTGERTKIGVWQVWCDPQHRDAHRAPAFRAWVYHQANTVGMLVLIRYGSREGFLLVAPALPDGEWIERQSGFAAEPQHTPAEVREALAGHIDIQIVGPS